MQPAAAQNWHAPSMCWALKQLTTGNHHNQSLSESEKGNRLDAQDKETTFLGLSSSSALKERHTTCTIAGEQLATPPRKNPRSNVAGALCRVYELITVVVVAM
jgi:hypothetical protein